MKSVFVAGSRAVSRLTPQIRERLDNIAKQHLLVLVGDANGADKAVQRYFAKCKYKNVVVYCMESCRNNVGGWPTRSHVAAENAPHDRHYYGVKDLAMAQDADCGLMLWDGISKGTLTNVFNLLMSHKKLLLYLAPQKTFFKLSNYEDFQAALYANGVQDIPGFLASLGMGNVVSHLSSFSS